MGHNSFIKGSITHVSLGFSRYLSVQHFIPDAFGRGGVGLYLRGYRRLQLLRLCQRCPQWNYAASSVRPSATSPWFPPGMSHRTTNKLLKDESEKFNSV